MIAGLYIKLLLEGILGLLFITKADALDCFSCVNITNIDDCHDTKQCLPYEFCYAESHQIGNNPVHYTLGCREQEFCRPEHSACTNTQFCKGIDQTRIVGRDVPRPPPLKGCIQCCNLHGCNKNLCPVTVTRAPGAVDGGWSDWGPWGDCNPKCGIGLQFRYRTCDNPTPSYNGRNCLGDAKDVQLCTRTCTVPLSTRAVTQAKSTPTSMATPTKSTNSSHYVTKDLTQAPGKCEDLIDCSGYYRPEACNGIYSSWSHRYCPQHCGFCPTASPIPCVDTISNCNEFQSDICTNVAFWQWRESHCRKYCKLC